MLEDQLLDEITAEIGGLPVGLWVRVHLKELNNETGTISPEGHIPASSYIANNVLTLYTDSTLKMPSYLIPPPMVRFIKVIRESGAWGVKLVSWTQKIPAIREVRNAFKQVKGSPCGLKEAKDFVEDAPSTLIEGLDKAEAERFMNVAIVGHHACCCLIKQGSEVD